MPEQISTGASAIDSGVLKAVGGTTLTAFLAQAGSILAFATAFLTFVLIFFSIREKIKNSKLIDAERVKIELENEHLKELIENNRILQNRIDNEKNTPDFSGLSVCSSLQPCKDSSASLRRGGD